MKRFMTTTAIAVIMGTSAMADGHTAMFSGAPYDAEINLTASDLLGARLYVTENDVDWTQAVTAEQSTEWDDVGEINEIILTRDGQAQSVIIGVGGFLGMGEKDVSVNMSDLHFVSDGDDADEYFVVIKGSKAGISDAPAYKRVNAAEASSMEAEVDTDVDEEMDTADTNADVSKNDDMRAMAPSIEREGYQTSKIDDLTTEDLTGARVYGVGDEDVGEIGKLLLTDVGKLDRAIIDVGGFLGMGEHQVAVPMDALTIIREDGGDDIRVYIDSSEEALEAQPEYKG